MRIWASKYIIICKVGSCLRGSGRYLKDSVILFQSANQCGTFLVMWHVPSCCWKIQSGPGRRISKFVSQCDLDGWIHLQIHWESFSYFIYPWNPFTKPCRIYIYLFYIPRCARRELPNKVTHFNKYKHHSREEHREAFYISWTRFPQLHHNTIFNKYWRSVFLCT